MVISKRAWVSIASLLFSSIFACSQNSPVQPFPDRVESSAFIVGQVVISDGARIGEPVAVQIVCNNRVRAEIYTDSQGNFNFDLSKPSDMSGPQPADVSRLSNSQLNDQPQWDNCAARSAL